MIDADILNEFVEESREHLGDIEIQLLSIEAMGADANDDLVNTVFRAIHSIKGAAGFLGLDQINQLSHRLENVLGKIREHELVPDPYNVDVMLKSADRLSGLIENIDTSNDTDNSDLCSQLDVILEGGDAKALATSTTDGGSSEGESQAGEPATSDEVAVAATEQVEQIETAVSEAVAPAPPATPDPPAAPAPPPTPAPTMQAAKAKSAAANRNEARTSADSTIRVSVRVLDQLMNLAGELVLSRNQLLRTLGEQANIPHLEKVASGLDQVTTELQETIMQTRMQPIGNVFNKFPRVIRDLSSSLGKSIDLSMEGNEVETDKTIVEAIADPLTHLIRNSCDHGIESPEVRRAAGKPEAGRVLLRAFHQAGKVMIEIVDDGAGMDPHKLRNKAVEKGVVTAEDAAAMSDHDAVNLIFAPGFSTAEQVTDVSGRGVGMDVVRTNIEKIGGGVEVQSELGKGSTILITLPLTLAIVPSMIVSVGDEPFALPQANIVELVQTGGSDKRVERVNNAEVLRLRGALLPLIRLGEVLGQDPEEQSECKKDADGNDRQQVVVVEAGRNRLAISVDRVLDSEEIVVKPLGKHLANLPLFAGSTILGDGRVAMILDIAGIVSQSGITADGDVGDDVRDNADNDELDVLRMVLISTSSEDHFAVSMDVVKRIERVSKERIENVGDRKMLQYRDGALPLLSLDEAITLNATDETDFLHVIVFSVYGREVGLLAPHLDDIAECDLTCLSETSSCDGVAGVAVVKDRTTRIIDIYGVTELARPEWFEKSDGTSGDSEARTCNLLVAEDSKFFRNFLVTTLVEEGHKVEAFEDGQEAWDFFQSTDQEFDLLLTDLEMPRMDGFALTRLVRAHDENADIPIIVLTSLADQSAVDRCYEVGATEHQVKMNKPDLLAAIQKHARS